MNDDYVDYDDLDTDIDTFIETFEDLAQLQLGVVLNTTWVDEKSPWTTKSRYKLHKKITETIILEAMRCYKAALQKGMDTHDKVINVVETAKKFFQAFESKYQIYKSGLDFTKLIEDSSKNEEMSDRTMEILDFGNTLNKDFSKLKGMITKISSLDAIGSVDVSTFDNVPVPFLMAETAEKSYPQILTHLEKRINADQKKQDN